MRTRPTEPDIVVCEGRLTLRCGDQVEMVDGDKRRYFNFAQINNALIAKQPQCDICPVI